MNIINFAHPLTEKQQRQIVQLLGKEPESVRTIKVHFDVNADFAPQVIQLVDDLGITPEEWRTGKWLVALPSLNYAAGILLAELHRRMGHFPAIVRLRAAPNTPVTEYEVAEIIDLDAKPVFSREAVPTGWERIPEQVKIIRIAQNGRWGFDLALMPGVLKRVGHFGPALYRGTLEKLSAHALVARPGDGHFIVADDLDVARGDARVVASVDLQGGKNIAVVALGTGEAVVRSYGYKRRSVNWYRWDGADLHHLDEIEKAREKAALVRAKIAEQFQQEFPERFSPYNPSLLTGKHTRPYASVRGKELIRWTYEGGQYVILSRQVFTEPSELADAAAAIEPLADWKHL